MQDLSLDSANARVHQHASGIKKGLYARKRNKISVFRAAERIRESMCLSMIAESIAMKRGREGFMPRHIITIKVGTARLAPMTATVGSRPNARRECASMAFPV